MWRFGLFVVGSGRSRVLVDVDAGLGEVFDYADQFVPADTATPSQADELGCALDDRAALGATANGDTLSAAELQYPFFSQYAKRAQHGVGVDAEHGCEILCRREAVSWLGLTVSDSAPNRGRCLVVQVHIAVAFNLDGQQASRWGVLLPTTPKPS